MPLAVQYGMPLSEFWHGDMRLLVVYQKAYLRDKNYTAWINGMYGRIAVEIGTKNTLVTKKSERIENWVEYKDPIEQIMDKPKITEDNLEEEFRKQQCRQSAWISNILKN